MRMQSRIFLRGDGVWSPLPSQGRGEGEGSFRATARNRHQPLTLLLSPLCKGRGEKLLGENKSPIFSYFVQGHCWADLPKKFFDAYTETDDSRLFRSSAPAH